MEIEDIQKNNKLLTKRGQLAILTSASEGTVWQLAESTQINIEMRGELRGSHNTVQRQERLRATKRSQIPETNQKTKNVPRIYKAMNPIRRELGQTWKEMKMRSDGQVKRMGKGGGEEAPS